MRPLSKFVPGVTLFAAALLVPPAAAQDKEANYPVRPLRILISVSPGAGADMVARMTAQILHERWGQNVIVDPRPGGGGVVASETLRKSQPDGYTLMQNGTGILFQTATKRVAYDVLKEFTPVVPLTMQPYILVAHPSVPATSIKELVAISAGKPLRYAGSSGIGGTVHFGMEELGRHTGMKLRLVPYKGSSNAYLALLGGEVQLVCGSVMSATTLIRSGKVRGIASLGLKRAVTLPDLPTAIEQGLPSGFSVDNRYALFVKAGTPRPIIEAINRAAAEGINAPQNVQRLTADGSEPAPRMTPEELLADLTRKRQEIDAQVKEMGLTF
jgi:tripartite-type tricarboxylate transporter receptor subunit TctC